MKAVGYDEVSTYSVSADPQGATLLAGYACQVYSKYTIQRPTTWIQPGGTIPHLSRSDIQTAYCTPYGFKTAASFVSPRALKCFGEYDPQRDNRLSMNWGDFLPETSTAATMKAIIADKVARHYVLIQTSHFSSQLGGWEGYLSRTDSLLDWCRMTGIPVRTMGEWGSLLYDSPQNPYTNTFPSLGVDLDGNGVPDGFSTRYGTGVLDTTDGVADGGNRSYTKTGTGRICYVGDLAGLEKGANQFSVWTKGAPGDSVDVTFVLPNNGVRLRFPSTTQGWRKYDISQSLSGTSSLFIPDSVSLASVDINGLVRLARNCSAGELKQRSHAFTFLPSH